MKTIILSVAFGFVFFALASVIFHPVEAYAGQLHMENSAWCQQALKDHAVAGDPIPATIVKMCAKELGA